MQETGRQSAGNAPQATKTRPWSGLSARLLWLTFVFVTLAEILIFLPSIANMRLNWLSDRLNTAAAASVVVDGLKDVVLPKPVRDHTLMATDTKAIVLTKDGMRHLIAMADMPPTVDYQYNLDDVSLPRAIYDAFDELLFGGDRVIRVFCPINKTGMKIEVVMADTNLRAAMITYSRNVLLISMVISLISAGLIFMAINRIMIRPIRRLTNSIERFSQHPEEADSIFEPGKGADELAAAGRHLQRMQKELQKTLRQQKNLAELGLAVPRSIMTCAISWPPPSLSPTASATPRTRWSNALPRSFCAPSTARSAIPIACCLSAGRAKPSRSGGLCASRWWCRTSWMF